MAPLELSGRVALVTGVSRRVGIAAAVARRLHDAGATVVATGWSPHDDEMPWGGSEPPDVGVPVLSHDLEDPDTPRRLVDEVIDAHGRLDIVAAVHARSSSASLADVTATELDRAWAVNVRSIVLLAQRFAEVHQPAPTDAPPLGRLVWFTSGQHLGPMDGEIAYAVTKGALHQMTASLDHALAPSRIIANCINPGPVDTGYADAELHESVASRFPDGRWGSPDDIADVVEFVVGDRGAWIRGQVIDAEGGFDRHA
ncbi:SDR family oxidoreductase [Ilumatobacter coccineus]|uniref:Putative oxidoreductase n=1 Tax=Ilumatobacter coccineus (strain NBRC 103263 / KCTC 29153 / YM16-304) TaxID=1313172 RepID=A0A6C7EH84_ILUCY|nr:SDR family oxidoreductase [Ilumatobacter coccineus]BAN04499.1 putative oxidoreductase [Ilumatobacter coccineus YM16-304]